MVPRQWENETVVLIASGPSLTPDDVDYVRGKCRVIAINDSYRLAPWADALYACDSPWWQHHHGCHDFPGQKWTQAYGVLAARRDPASARRQLNVIEKYDLLSVCGAFAKGLSLCPSLIHYGGNSGFQALNLAVHFGAKRIVLLGFDMRPSGGKSHWFGNHPPGLQRHSPYTEFISAFEGAVDDLTRAGVEVINCTPHSALQSFPHRALKDVL